MGYNTTTSSFIGKMELFNITADPAETHDLSSFMPDALEQLKQKLKFYGVQAARVAPISQTAPWQGPNYFCANCVAGRPAQSQGVDAWEPWCDGGADVPCLKQTVMFGEEFV